MKTSNCRLNLRESMDYSPNVSSWEPADFLKRIPAKGLDVCLFEEGCNQPILVDGRFQGEDSIENFLNLRLQLCNLLQRMVGRDDVLVFLLKVEEQELVERGFIEHHQINHLHYVYGDHLLILKGSWQVREGTLIVVPCEPEHIERIFAAFWGRGDDRGGIIAGIVVDELICDKLDVIITGEHIRARSWQDCLDPLIRQSKFYFEDIYSSRVLRFISTSQDVMTSIQFQFTQF